MTASLTGNLPLLAGAPNGIKKLRELILELAVRGKLLEQNADDEAAGELLKQITEENSQLIVKGKTREQVPLQEIDEVAAPFKSAPGWLWIKLGDISLIERGGSPRPIKDFLTEDADGLNWIKIGDTDKGGKYITSAGERIRREGLVKTRMVYPGDFLLTNSMSFGRPYITQIEGCIHDGWLRISPPSSLVKDYLYLLLSSPYVHSFFVKAAAGAVVLNLNADKVRELPIPLPPLAEQHRIVAKVDELMALCDQLKIRLTQARQLNEKLASTLVERALNDDGKQAPLITDKKTARTLLAAEVTHRLHAQRTFGQRKLQKVIYLAEHAAGLNSVQGSYLRNVAGPHDRYLMNQVEAELQKQQWYERIDRDTIGHAYRPLSLAGQHRQAYNRTWSANEQARIEQVIELMRDWDTDRCEMTVTLYAAWNDFIIEGRLVTDEAIVDEVMHRWNEAKLRFSKGKWLAVLSEMKKHDLLTPTGFGKRTTGGTLILPGIE